MKNKIMIITNEVGLHARPAALFVKTASRFKSKIQARNLTNGKSWANAKSIINILALGVSKDNQVEVQAEGEDEDQAIQALDDLVNSDFNQ